VVSFKETPLTSVDKVEVGQLNLFKKKIFNRKSFLGPNPLSPSGSSWTLRIHYLKDEQTSGYYHQFRGTNVQVFNTTVMLLKEVDQINGN
jgi:hypothetical protein